MLAVLVAADAASPAVVLVLTLRWAARSHVAVPSFASLIPDLVPHADLASAVTLNGISINLARAVGPALAGVALACERGGAVRGPGGALAAMAVVLGAPAAVARPSGARAGAAMRAGVGSLASAPAARGARAWVRFVVPASALWAMLPAVAVHRLGLDRQRSAASWPQSAPARCSARRRCPGSARASGSTCS